MQKSWHKIKENKYCLFVNEQQVGELNFKFGSRVGEAVFTSQQEHFTISRAGFWKPTIVIEDKKGIRLAEFKPEKWYSTTMKGIYKKRELAIEIRNKPLVEYVIKEFDQDLLVYGLDFNQNKGMLKITNNSNLKSELLFDALLWYLFYPIATENASGDITPFTLLST